MSKTSLLKSDSSSDSEEETHQSIGPSLPPHLQHKVERDTLGPELPPNLKTEEWFGPPLPPHIVSTKTDKRYEIEPKSFGPHLPPHLQDSLEETFESSTEKEEPRDIGPILPPHLRTNDDFKINEEETKSFGPALPPHLQSSSSSRKKPEKLLGPELPPGFVPPDNSSDEDDSYGPDPRLMTSGEAAGYNDVNERLERSRRKMLEKANKKLERETWMLDLPPERAANLGLGPRQFRAKPAPEMGDRSIWTDTPADKAKKQHLPPKVDDKDLIRKELIAARDEEMEKMAKKAESKLKRKESLLESHSKKLKKEAKHGKGKPDKDTNERKRFNREEDMHVNRFDEAQKKAIFKKAQLLNDRFSQGESKYL